ncbi:MAG TPA: malto-oligosyltrehalose synthase [Frankiaceae bacterium]|nr:malto-oligosyltrehalose synthase [Frankiaceae bacterium]
MTHPTSTYRVQVNADFPLPATAEVVDYLRDLGVGALYTSPILRSTEGSTHGYDVLAHDAIDDEAGGRAALDALSARLRNAGLGLVVDVVPNHVAISPPADANAWFWDVLQHGRDSRYAKAFDVDWSRHGGRILLPVLGASLREVLDAGEIVRAVAAGSDDSAGTAESSSGDVLRYHEHVWPLAPGTADGELDDVIFRQHYLPDHWRSAAHDLNYRRFFDVTTLAGLRVEDPQVFEESHALVVELVRDGTVTGLRVDHPDGLAEPAEYLDRLAEATGGVWTVVEKILEPGEHLPAEWQCAGTTGYDALAEVTGLFVDPAGEDALTRVYTEFTGDATPYDEVVARGKRLVLTEILGSEVEWLHRLLPHEPREAIVELLVAMPVYRTYARPGAPPSDHDRAVLAEAVARAPEEWRTAAERIAGYLLDGTYPAFTTRFQQTSGPAMAKGVEDTAFYRYTRLASLNEVGGSPAVFGPTRITDRGGMTTLSTHDTKRSEDVRARISLLSEVPEEWGAAVRRWSALAARHGSIERNLEYLMFQTFVGAYPLDADRAVAYALKAAREQKQRTSWLDQDEAYEAELERWVRGTLADPDLTRDLDAFMAPLVGHGWTASLAQKLVQLTMPGVPDVYQGCELWDYSLVDPDNRRPVDYATRRRLLAELATLDAEAITARAAEGLPKLHVVRTALHLRRERPEAFDGSYEPVEAAGAWADRVVAFARGGAVLTVVPRLTIAVDDWKDTTLPVPAGTWRNLLTGDAVAGGGARPVAELFARFPVALLERETP